MASGDQWPTAFYSTYMYLPIYHVQHLWVSFWLTQISVKSGLSYFIYSICDGFNISFYGLIVLTLLVFVFQNLILDPTVYGEKIKTNADVPFYF